MYWRTTDPFQDCKVLERVVASRIHTHLSRNNLHTKNQSAYRSGDGVESALLSISDSILRSLDTGKGVIMLLLDMSTAYDTIDHKLLISTLHHHLGITGNAIKWISSYITDRTFQVKVGSVLSRKHSLQYGVPQGSVLGPLLYTAYTSSLDTLIEHHSINFHFYTDDTQLLVPVDLDDPTNVNETVSKLEECVECIWSWILMHKLKLNAEKTELL